MKRRDFIKTNLVLSTGAFSLHSASFFCAAGNNHTQTKIVSARDVHLQTGNGQIDTDRLIALLDKSVQAFFDRDNSDVAWKQIARPGEVIGLKVNCLSGKRGGTHRELVSAVCERLQAIGIKAQDIIIWDRLNEDLEDGGFQVSHRERKIQCYGNDMVGFASDFEIYGSAASLITKTMTEICDGVINMPVLKDHGIAGITMSLKNMFGAIHNPNKYHLNVGDPYIADVYMLPSIRKKVRFTICDAIQAQYEGGPSFMPQWCWPYNGLLVGTDPVALDYHGWQIIEQKRLENKLKSLKQDNREPRYINTAADKNHQIGINDPDRISVIEV